MSKTANQTNERQKMNTMKIRLTPIGKAFAIILLLALIVAIFCSGCTSTNPDYPATSSDPYRISPEMTNAATTIRGVHEVTKPLNPYSPLSGVAVESGLALALAIAAWIAKRKNDEAKRESNAADSLAQVVVSKGNTTVLEALAVAGENEAGEVVKHLEANKSATVTVKDQS